MSGRHSRNKGAAFERLVVRLFQAAGIAAEKISGMYKLGADIIAPLLGMDREIECKKRASGATVQMYKWLDGRFAVVHAIDRQEPLITLRFRDAIPVWQAAERSKLVPPQE